MEIYSKVLIQEVREAPEMSKLIGLEFPQSLSVSKAYAVSAKLPGFYH